MRKLVFVTGYFGAPILSTAKAMAKSYQMELVILDDLIEKKDGRSIRRICMAGGEHGYRNLEYELVKDLSESAADGGDDMITDGEANCDGMVVACGDGILYDDQTRDLILRHTLVIAGKDIDPEKLWENALKDNDTWHAFMLFGTKEEKLAAFKDYINRQKELFDQIKDKSN